MRTVAVSNILDSMAEPIIEVGGTDSLWAEPIIEVGGSETLWANPIIKIGGTDS